MRVYILASPENISFAEEVVSEIRNVKIIPRPANDEFMNMNVAIKKKMESADIILAIVDDNFAKNMYLDFELKLAQILVRENRNKILIPVVLNNAIIPEEIKGILYISCDTNLDSDLSKIKLMIEKVLTHRNFNMRKKRAKELRSKTSSMMIITLAIEVFAIFFMVLFFKYPLADIGYMYNESSISLLLGIVTAVSLFTLSTSYLSIMKRRWQEDEEEEIKSYSRRLERAIFPKENRQEEKKSSGDVEKKKEIDALGRMMINLEDIKEFYTWSQRQAKASFVLAVTMCIAGFLLMTLAVFLPVVCKLSIQMSIIPAIGGVITELVAGTALVVYRNSLAQLNHYHKALHEDERFLSSVNLLGKFSTVQAQDEMLREIIRCEIKMNLVGASEAIYMQSDTSKDTEKLM